MSVLMKAADPNAALQMLLKKYGVAAGTKAKIALCGESGALVPGDSFAAKDLPAGAAALLPWRVERRFVELKNLVDNKTVEKVSTLRFASMRAGANLAELLYREFDLCEWIGGSRIVSLFASFNAPHAANVIVKLDSGVAASVEVGATLPAGSAPVDRHEIIAARGVASDRVVDTQMPQHSVYVMNAKGENRFTDTDAELYGLSEEEILAVRAAYKVLANEKIKSEWQEQHVNLRRLVQAALKSDAECVRVSI